MEKGAFILIMFLNQKEISEIRHLKDKIIKQNTLR